MAQFDFASFDLSSFDRNENNGPLWISSHCEEGISFEDIPSMVYSYYYCGLLSLSESVSFNLNQDIIPVYFIDKEISEEISYSFKTFLSEILSEDISKEIGSVVSTKFYSTELSELVEFYYKEPKEYKTNSKFNLGGFNRLPFNSGRSGPDWYSISLTETVYSAISLYGATYYFAQLYELLNVSKVEVSEAVFLETDAFEETIDYTAELIKKIFLYDQFSENISNEAEISVKLFPKITLLEEIDNDAEISTTKYYQIETNETVSCELSIGEDYYILEQVMSELVSSVTDLTVTEQTLMLINVTLEPGDILTIDSENFNVFLNDENIIHLHSGNWITDLNRRTESVQVLSSVNDLECSITYKERYL